jgi:arabinose-5-phosphate isomerase
MNTSSPSSLDLARRVLDIEAAALRDLGARLDVRFDHAVNLLANCKGRVIVAGMGKSGIIARKIAATFSSTGTPALFLHPAEAVHGDLGAVVGGDVVVALSYSGETEEVVRLLEPIKRLGLRLISMTGAPASTLAASSDVDLDVRIAEEACPLGLAPTTSTTVMLALGDALALALLDRRGFSPEDFAQLHPAGKLGDRLRRVAQLMHTGDEIPQVSPSTAMSEVIYEMSRKRLGVTAVTAADGKLLGILSDGDLRRLLLHLHDLWSTGLV